MIGSMIISHYLTLGKTLIKNIMTFIVVSCILCLCLGSQFFYICFVNVFLFNVLWLYHVFSVEFVLLMFLCMPIQCHSSTVQCTHCDT